MTAADIVADASEKKRRVLEFFDESGYQAMVIGRQDDFAWFTCGGDNKVVLTSETGVVLLVITHNEIHLVSQTMDADRVIQEEVAGLGYHPVVLKWFEKSREEAAIKIVQGLRTISDIPMEGADFLPDRIHRLHEPLTIKEIERCRWIGQETEKVFQKVAAGIHIGMSEHELEAEFLYEYGKRNMQAEVLLIGSDRRIAEFRHPNPTGKQIEHFVLMHAAVRKWGLHANITRMAFIGDRLPEGLEARFDLANRLQAQAITMSTTGELFTEIFRARRTLLTSEGFADEWMMHYPGGITGYQLCDIGVCTDPDRKIVDNQAFDWFITLAGIKVEELSLNTGGKREIPSISGQWPTRSYKYGDYSFQLPRILMI